MIADDAAPASARRRLARAVHARRTVSVSNVRQSAAHARRVCRGPRRGDPLADIDPWLHAAVDWDATLAYRHHLWDLGFSVAEAMDTAQRGMGLDWPTTRS